ncbi:MAG: metallophosphoesterase, partial [Methyloceanibacter sp.]
MRDEVKSATEATEADSEPWGLSRRGALTCMVGAGTGILWTLSGGVPKSFGLLGDALAAEASAFTFLQISDS